MGEKIIVGPVNKGLRTDRLPFVIDNDSFPSLINAYQWRGRVKRKRGTALLGRLQRFFNSTVSSYSSTSTINLSSGAANILTGFSLQANGNIVPGSVTITDTTASVTYTDPGKAGVLVGSPSGSGTINYATGAITISGGGSDAISAKFFYYPDLPVMGLEDFVSTSTQYPGTLAFDTVYSYDIQTFSPYGIYDVSFYKNPPSNTYPSYVKKTNVTPTSWNGQNYQQFFTVNYEGALWATNGVNTPLPLQNIGMQFNAITNITNIVSGPPATAQLTIASHGLVVGDFLFINEVVGVTGINFQTGYVIAVVDANNVSVEFPDATLGGAYSSGGIAQYLTNRSDPTKDCLRWYDGDPTNGSATSPALTGNLGWVNFAPPISQASFTIDDAPEAQYYLVGAKMIVPFKDRLLFLAPVIQTSAANSQIFLQDTIIYSQNGTPYYTCSFTGSPTSSSTVFNPILVPKNQIATASAYFDDSTGFGGNIAFGLAQTMNTVSNNEDALIIGFDNLQTRLIYTGNDIVPFNAFIINTEYGSGSTFSTINMDKGVLTTGRKGFIITSQVEARRFDLEILDHIFEVSLINNGTERVTAQRDFQAEWIYFTYVNGQTNSSIYVFPNRTLQYNYRDDSWGVFNESYTTYGSFRQQTGDTWSNIGNIFPTWSVWNVPWEDGESTNLLQPQIIGGNQQGFVILRNVGTNEANSLYIQSISNGTVTSPDHGLNQDDFIIISGCIGVNGVNNRIFQVGSITEDTFLLAPIPADSGSGYVGGGVIQRLYMPFIQSKQFPPSWNMARKTRLGAQQYLLTATASGQVQLLIFLSENPIGDPQEAYNLGDLVPGVNVVNNTLIYSTLLYTCPEGTNLGLTPANVNLNLVTAPYQNQIWHRMNTSLIGDTVQMAITLSDAQMTSMQPSGTVFTITGATNANPCVLTCTNTLSVNQLIQITGVQGMTQLNYTPQLNNYYNVIAATSSSITIDVDSTLFGTYTSGGQAVVVSPIIQFSEIELHAFVVDVSPSQVLA